MRKTTRKMWVAAAGVSSMALLATGCSSNNPSGDTSSSSSEPVTLTVATFNDFGYTDALLAEYTKAHPNVTVKQTKAAKSEDARTNLTTKLGAGGAGLADIEAIEVDWLPELLQAPDKFVDLSDPKLKNRWVDWKVKQATAANGALIGYGTDIGPEGICYRSDLFKAAGLPTDRADVAALLGGDNATWDKYYEVGKQFVAKTPKVAWFDSANATYQGIINQQTNAYEQKDGTPKDLASNSDVKGIYNSVLAASATLSAHLNQWSPDWDAAFQANGFATMLCPAWMTGPIEQRAGKVAGWDVADVFPGGGGNWGGSFLTVPASGKHTAAAKELAAWLTSPETQVKAFANAGTFPSQVDAYKDATLTGAKNAFFNNAPVGEIFANRAKAVTVTPFKGANYFTIHQTVTDAITKVDVDKSADAATAWTGAVQAYKDLGLS